MQQMSARLSGTTVPLASAELESATSIDTGIFGCRNCRKSGLRLLHEEAAQNLNSEGAALEENDAGFPRRLRSDCGE